MGKKKDQFKEKGEGEDSSTCEPLDTKVKSQRITLIKIRLLIYFLK
jgi:hypothetical protein